jgi:predicted RNA-binding protein YlqC (UPF0109 family)
MIYKEKGEEDMKRDMSDLLKEFAVTTIKYLIPELTEIDVNIVKSTINITIQIKIPKENRGRLIGKRGHTIDTLKTLFTIIKNSNFPDDRRMVNTEIIEEENYFSRT